ncbi:MAG: histone deacetylase [Gemmataceae bacterium]
MTLLYHDPLFQRHDTGAHPERSDRLRAIDARLQAEGLLWRCNLAPIHRLSADQTFAVHTAEVVQRIERLAQAGGGRLDADTVVCPDSLDVALAAAGSCCAAVEAVLSGQDRNALCLVRPPGHHATPTNSMGFCLFNNVALAARQAQKLGAARVLIIDWDVHHGNGTQDIFYADPSVTFVSIHRYGGGFYPGTGAADETGSGPGLGHTFNIPLPRSTGRAAYLTALENVLHRALAVGKPDLVLISAGFDAHRNDPIGGLNLEIEDFTTLTRLVMQVADSHSQGKLVSCLEGGYDLEALAGSVAVHLRALLGEG